MTTNCVSPPELDDKQLLAYLDNPEANPETANHLEKCLYCLEKAETLDRWQRRLTTRLYRLTCPPTIELGEYHLRMLPASRMLVVAQHLRECPHCAREADQLEEFLSELAPQSAWLEPVKVLIARLISGRGINQEPEGSSVSPAFAGLRGEVEEPFIYQADHVQIIIEIQKDVEQPELMLLLGLVMGLESNVVTVRVSRNGQVIITTSVDEIGNFVIPHLVSGVYELTFTGADIEISIPALSV